MSLPFPCGKHIEQLALNFFGKIKTKPTIKEEIKKHCEDNLAKYSWPYKYEFRDELPKTLVGKVAYNELIKEEQAKHEKK